MKVTSVSLGGRVGVVHDDIVRIVGPSARCAATPIRLHVLPANATTTCKRCLRLRKSSPYIYNLTHRLAH